MNPRIFWFLTFFSIFDRISMMSFVRQGVGLVCPTWSKGPWQDKSHLLNVLVRLIPLPCLSVVFSCLQM